MEEPRTEGPAAPTRVCPNCATQSQTAGDYCPQCGASFVRRRRFARIRGASRRAKLIALAVLVLLLAGGGTAALLIKQHHDDQVHAQKLARDRAAKKAADVAAADAAAAAAQQQQQEQAAATERRIKISLRRELVRSLEHSITKDARKDVGLGALTGPILSTSCQPVAGGNIDNLAAHTGAYSCLAVNKHNSDGTDSGYGFSGTVNYESDSYTWHLGNGGP